MPDPHSTPPGECPQCWHHAHDRTVHKGMRGDCPQCVDHMLNGCPNRVPKRSRWW
ncbi:pRL2-8 [Streptomyces triticagri]|uniref:PRL2-8 n=1 Tax=Streptomyces triticagri TaxID=2293568 RepID=A0A372LX87_9ACTN|nr:pRL2-8 [Streptomyces triticagri]RFU83274.1 pRL2-8 [Streptomyces triticagri]